MSKKNLVSVLLLIILTSPALSVPIPRFCYRNCKVGSAGYTLIKSAEGFSPFVYKDAIGIPTIGFGHAIKPSEKIKTPLMGTDALALLRRDIAEREAKLNAIIATPLTSNQFDALASLFYNIGERNFQRSTLLKKVNAQLDEEVPAQFLLWDKAGGREIKGLLMRRRAEAELFDNYDFAEM